MVSSTQPTGTHPLTITASGVISDDEILSDVGFVLTFFGTEQCLTGLTDQEELMVFMAARVVQEHALGRVPSPDPEVALQQGGPEADAWIRTVLTAYSRCRIDDLPAGRP